MRSWLFVRSNLTLLDEVLIHGEGGSGQLIFREPSGAQLETLLMSVPEKNLRFCAGETQPPVSKPSSKKKGSKSEDEERASDQLQIKTQQAFVLANHGNLDVFVHGMRLGTCDKDKPSREECECASNGFALPRCLRNATIRPGETLRVPVTFESDFSTSRATTKLIVLSSAGPLTFALQAQLPHHVLPMCRAQLRLRTRPSEGEQRARAVVTALLLVALVALGQLTLKELRLKRAVTIRLVSCRHSVPAEATKEATPSAPGEPSSEAPPEGGSPQGKPVAARRVPPPGSSTGSEDGRDSPELPAAALASAQTNGAAAHAPLKEVVPVPPTPETEAKPPPPAKPAAAPTAAPAAAAKPKAGSAAASPAPAVASPRETAAPAPTAAGSPQAPPSAAAAPPSAAAAAQTASAPPPSPAAQQRGGPGPDAHAARARTKAEAGAEAPPGAPPPAKPELLHRTSSSSSSSRSAPALPYPSSPPKS